MKNAFYPLCFLLFFSLHTNHIMASIYRGGEITFLKLQTNLYEITVTTYTDPTNLAADRNEIEVDYGDGHTETVLRFNGNGEILSSVSSFLIKKNVYKSTHQYLGSGNYKVSFNDPNRVGNILNMNNGNSINIPFYIETLIVANNVSSNHSPQFSAPPTGLGCLNKLSVYDPMVSDPDGDSLAFQLSIPLLQKGISVPNYFLPASSNFFKLDEKGIIHWDSPLKEGLYNLTLQVSKYHQSILQSTILRDIEIYVQTDCLSGLNNEKTNGFDLNYYPNPANTQLAVTIGNLNYKNVVVELTDLYGRLLYSEIVNNDTNILIDKIDLSTFNNGIYFLKVWSGNNEEKRKIIISR